MRSGCSCSALAGGSRRLRARAVRRPRRRGGHRRGGHVRRLHPQRLPGRDPDARAAREPDLVRLDARTTSRWPASSTGRRSASSRSSPIVLFVGRRRGLRAARPRRDERRSRRPACRGPSSACGARPVAHPARTCRRRSRGASGSGCSASSIAGSGKSFIDAARQGDRTSSSCSTRSSRASTSGRSAGSSSCSSSSSA